MLSNAKDQIVILSVFSLLMKIMLKFDFQWKPRMSPDTSCRLILDRCPFQGLSVFADASDVLLNKRTIL